MTSELPEPRGGLPVRGQRVALVDLLDRLLAGGVVITGDITISIADVDLVRISLRALIASIRPEMERMLADEDPAPPYQTIRATVYREDEQP
ncbi:gas vesicle protein [Actinomadura scrupuli]|uniref:gas vesicle protein n=1 Tax=Actinomadura scrupuli TaxID=559629 RepID=UPI003D96F69C